MVWVKRVFGTALLAVAVWFAWPVLGPKTTRASLIAWQPYAPQSLAHPGKPVLIDFSADWCIPCHEMEKKTFRDARVVEKAKQFLMLRADMTASGSPAVEELSKQYGIQGVPTFIFFDADGRPHAELRRVGFVAADEFLSLMENAMQPARATTNATSVAIPPQLMQPF
jgi:thiol:disulfide interchange protein DsbD